MSEYFDLDYYSLKLCSFELLNEKINLTIFPHHTYSWINFFLELEKGTNDYDKVKLELVKDLASIQYPDILEENILKIWEQSPMFFSNGYIKNNFDFLESNSEFFSLMRQIKIDKIIA
jgi:hypothetical protein